MADFDLKSELVSTVSLAPAVRTTDTNGTAVDTLDFGAVTFEVYVGAGGITFDGSNYLDIILQDSDDNSTYTAVPTEDLILGYGQAVSGTNTGIVRRFQAAKAAADLKSELFGYRGKKRYVRAVADFTGTHGTGTLVGVNVLLGKPYHQPIWATSIET